MMNKHQRKQMILLGGSVVMLVATILLFMQVFKPNSAFLEGSFETSETSSLDHMLTLPLEFFRDPRFALLAGDALNPPARQVAGVRVNSASPTAPVNIQGHDPKVGSKAFVEWAAPVGFADARFVVYRSEIPSSLGEVVSETNESSFLDSGLMNNRAYYYTVHTATESGESTNAEQVAVTPTDTTPPAPPADVTAASNEEGDGVVITWVASPDDDVASVTIYRSETAGVLGEVIASGLVETSYVDTTVLENTPYSYTLTAVDGSGNESLTSLTPVLGRDNPFLPI